MKTLVTSIILSSMLSSGAWAMCDEVYTERADYLKSVDVIVVGFAYPQHNRDNEITRKFAQPMKKLDEVVRSLLPPKTSIKVINAFAGGSALAEARKNQNAVGMQFTLSARKAERLFSDNLASMTVRMGNYSSIQSTDFLWDESIAFTDSGNSEELDKKVKDAATMLSKNVLNTLACIKDGVCQPSKCGSDLAPRPARREFKNEDDILQRMKELEKKK